MSASAVRMRTYGLRQLEFDQGLATLQNVVDSNRKSHSRLEPEKILTEIYKYFQGTVAKKYEFDKLAKAFQCKRLEHNYEFTCKGPKSWAIATQACLSIASTAALLNGSPPVAVTLIILKHVVSLWEIPEAKTTPDAIKSAVGNMKNFGFTTLLSEAQAQATVMSDKTHELQISTPLEGCDDPRAVPLLIGLSQSDDAARDKMAAILSHGYDAMDTKEMEKDADVDFVVLRKRIAIIDGFENTWSLLSMHRLSLLSAAIDKVAGCNSFAEDVQNRMSTLLTRAAPRKERFSNQWKVTKVELTETAEDLEVAAIRGRSMANAWGERNASIVKLAVPKLSALGEAGASYLGELLEGNDLGLVADILEIMHNYDVTHQNGCRTLLPIANALTKILVNPAAQAGALTPATPKDVRSTIRSQKIALLYLDCFSKSSPDHLIDIGVKDMIEEGLKNTRLSTSMSAALSELLQRLA